MNGKRIAIFCFYVLTNLCYSQHPVEDSLFRLLQTQPKPTHKTDILNQLAHFYRSSNFEMSEYYGQQGLRLADSLDYRKGKSDALFYLANLRNVKRQYLASIDYYRRAETLLDPVMDVKRLSEINNGMAAAFNNLNQTDSAEYRFRKSILFAIKSEDKAALAQPLNNLGLLRIDQNRYSEAKTLFNFTLASYEEAGIVYGIARAKDFLSYLYGLEENYLRSIQLLTEVIELHEQDTIRFAFDLVADYSNIAGEYTKIGAHDLAMPYHLKALRYSSKAASFEHRVSTYLNISNAFDAIKDKEESALWLERALDTLEVHPSKHFKPRVLHNYAGLLIELGNEKKAEEYYHQSLSLFVGEGDNELIPGVYNGLGLIAMNQGENEKARIYFLTALSRGDSIGTQQSMGIANLRLGMLNHEEKKFDNAKKRFLEAIGIFGKTGMLMQLAESWKKLSDTYTLSGQSAKALEAHKMFKTVYDSLAQKEKTAAIALAETKLKLGRLQDQEKVLTEKVVVTSGRLKLVWGLVGLAVLLSCFFLWRFLRSKKSQKVALVKAEELEKNVSTARTEAQQWKKQVVETFALPDTSIPFERIEVLEAAHEFTIPHFIDSGKASQSHQFIHLRLGKALERAPRGAFYRIHKSYAVKLSRFSKVEIDGKNYRVVMKSGARVKIGNTYRKSFLELVKSKGD